VNGAWIEIQVAVFWVMTPCSDVVGYRRFGGPYCLHLQGEFSGAWVEIQVKFLCVMTLCSDVVGYPSFEDLAAVTTQKTTTCVGTCIKKGDLQIRNFNL
jgi:hypothetical protein